jgi:PAS domain S-box-containing protein
MRLKLPFQHSKYGRVLDLLPEFIFIVKDDGAIMDYNENVEKLLDKSGKDFELNNIRDILKEGEEEKFFTVFRQHSPEVYFRTEFSLPGELAFDVELTLKELQSEDGKYTVIFAKDITEQQKKELDLLRFSEVIHHTVNPIEITDQRGKIIYVNPAFEKVSGYSQEELLGKNPNVLSSGKHPAEFWQQIWKTILGGKEWVGQVQNRRKGGELFYTELVISPIIDASGNVVGFLGAHRDITEQKMLEEQLVRSQKMETFGTLAAGIAHEVGNPLTSISSIVQVIQRTSNDRFAHEKLELVKNQINRIAKIIRELVDFSRPSAYEVKDADVNAIIRDATNIVQYGKKVHDIHLSSNLQEPLPTVAVVPDQLVQVFLNILMNAVDACEGKKGEIGIASRMNGKNIEVEISDTGTGIEERNMGKIFDPFFTTKEIGKGTGLGLWVSLGIIKNFGGDIKVQSETGKGSSFKIYLPTKGASNG